MHTVRLLLDTTKYDEYIINRRFHAVSHIHNVLVKHAMKLLKKLSFDTEYQNLRQQYGALLKKGELSESDEEARKQLSTSMREILSSYGLSEFAFQAYIKVCARQFKKLLSSQQVQKEATRVWKGAEAVIYGDGKEISFKKFNEFSTICGKTNTNGAKFIKDETGMSVRWLGLNIRCVLPKERAYIDESLDNKISYCEIERKMFPNGWHYYVIVYLKGDAPHKLKKAPSAENTTGLDMGVSTIAAVSDKSVMLAELAPKCSEYDKRISKILVSMDASRRAMNPNKYNADGTIKKGNRDKWVFSKTYIKNLRKLRSLYRQKSAYIKQSHREMINKLLEESVNFIVEDMSFKGLARKAKETKRSDKTTEIKQKDGSVKAVNKFCRKKRFGRSMNNRAPALFLTLLSEKAAAYGGSVYKVDTKKFKASQFDHTTGEYTKHKLSEREKEVGGHMVQRDLYSAFLLKNANNTLDKPDVDKCNYEFDNFLRLQDKTLTSMKANGISMKQCFGF